MIIPIHIQANPARVHISTLLNHRSFDVANVVARGNLNVIVAVGKTPHDMQREAPDHWEQHKHDITLVYPFDTAQFDPEAASIFVRYYTVMLHQELRRHFYSIWCLIDRFDFDIRIQNYDRVTTEQRAGFQEELKAFLRIRNVSIQSW